MPDEKYEKLAREIAEEAYGIKEIALALERVALEAEINAYALAGSNWDNDSLDDNLRYRTIYQSHMNALKRLEELGK